MNKIEIQLNDPTNRSMLFNLCIRTRNKTQSYCYMPSHHIKSSTIINVFNRKPSTFLMDNNNMYTKTSSINILVLFYCYFYIFHLISYFIKNLFSNNNLGRYMVYLSIKCIFKPRFRTRCCYEFRACVK